MALLAAGLIYASSSLAGNLAANTLPSGGQVAQGQASITSSGNVMSINQNSQRAVINWNSFNVGSSATVNFNQPNASSSTLNRVNSATHSMINGAVNSNGQVIFVNPNGVIFGKGAEINVGGITATSMNISDTDYMSGRMTYSGNGNNHAKVINKGNITANNINGYIALMAPEVKNEGVLVANLSGNNMVALVSGQTVSLSFNGNQLVDVAVDASVIKSLIANKRLIQVGGGQVIIAANAASDLKASVINNVGIISADGFGTDGGKLTLVASSVNQNGTVSANSDTKNAGQIIISGKQVNMNAGSITSAVGASAGGQILIGKTNTNNAVSAVNADTVTVSQGALVDVSATRLGNGGLISIWSKAQTSIAGTLRAKGGVLSGNGGMIDTSSAGLVTYGSSLIVDTTARQGKIGLWLTDPLLISIDASAAAILSNALLTTNISLDATQSGCGAIGTCSPYAIPVISFLADVYSANPLTSLFLNAQGGTINIDSNITAGSVYAVAQEININGSINTNGGSNSNIYLAGATISILGNINSNGNNQNNSNSNNLNSANIATGNNRRSGKNGLTSDNAIYTGNGGIISILASNDISIGNYSVISANGISGGLITIVSTGGTVSIQGIVDATGKLAYGGNISIAGLHQTILTGALISSEGLSAGGVINLGQVNNLGNGSTLAPPATAPPAFSTFINNTLQKYSSTGTTASSNLSGIISTITLIDSQSDIDAPSGSITVFGQYISINDSYLNAINGSIAVGRPSYGQGELAIYANVSRSTLAANQVETSGKALKTTENQVNALRWLLDPVNVTISAGTTSGGTVATSLNYTSNLLAFANQTGAATINVADIQNALAAGTSVNIVASGSITQSAAISADNNVGAASLTLDNRSGLAQKINLGTITLTGSAPTSLYVYSAGGGIASNGTIAVTGSIVMDNTYEQNGLTSGFLFDPLNVTTSNVLASGNGVAIKDLWAGGSVMLNGVSQKGAAASIKFSGDISAGQILADSTISISAAYPYSSATSTNNVFAFSSDVSIISGTSGGIRGGDINIWTSQYTAAIRSWGVAQGSCCSSSYSITMTAYGSNIFLGTANNPLYSATTSLAGALNNGVSPLILNATKINGVGGDVSIYATGKGALNIAGSINADRNVTIVGNVFSGTNPAVSWAGPITFGGDLYVQGLLSSAGSSTGVNITGLITGGIGSNLTFVSNNSITTSTIDLPANTSSVASNILFDTTAGNQKSNITFGTVSVSGDSNSLVNLSAQSAGSTISVPSINVPGSITLDNTFGCSGASCTPASGHLNASTISSGNATSGNGIFSSASGLISAGASIAINGVSSGSGYAVALGGSLSSVGDTTVKGSSLTGGGINISGSLESAGGVSLATTGSGNSSGAFNSIVVNGLIENTGLVDTGISISAVGNVSLSNLSNAGSSGIRIAGGQGLAAGNTSGGTITALGSIANTGGFVSLSMAKPEDAKLGGAIETAVGIVAAAPTSGQSLASTNTNIAYSQLGGVFGAPNSNDGPGPTANTISYRSAPSGASSYSIAITPTSYSQIYGTPYDGGIASGWLNSIANTQVNISLSGPFGVDISALAPTANQVLASLKFASNIGGSSSNLVQAATPLVTGTIVSSLGSIGVDGNATYTITPAPLTITAADQSTTYGTALVLGTNNTGATRYTASGLVNSDAVSAVVLNQNSNTTVPATQAADTYSGSTNGILVSGATGTGLSNYTITYVPGALTVDQKALSITAANTSKTYDGLAYTGGNGVTYSGFVNNQNASALGGTLVYGGTAQNAINAATYTITPSGLTSSNYAITYANGSLSVNKANATVTANSANVLYNGNSQSVSGFTASGLVNGESVAVLTGVTVSGASGTNYGTYTNTVTGADSNYNLTLVNGTLSIAKAGLTVTGVNTGTSYAGQVQTNSVATVTGAQGTDSFTITGYGTGTNAGTYPDNLVASAAGSTLATNYNITYNNGALTIGKAALTISGSNSALTFNNTLQSNSYTVSSGVIPGEIIGASGFARGLHVGAYSDQLQAVAGPSTNLQNYQVTIINGALTINPLMVNISGLQVSTKTYDTTPAATFLGNAQVAGNTYGLNVAVTGKVSGLFSTSNVGDSISVNPNLSGLTLSNSDFVIGSVASPLNGSITPYLLNVNWASTTSTTSGINGQILGINSGGVLVNGLGLNGGLANNYRILNVKPAQLIADQLLLNRTAQDQGSSIAGNRSLFALSAGVGSAGGLFSRTTIPSINTVRSSSNLAILRDLNDGSQDMLATFKADNVIYQVPEPVLSISSEGLPIKLLYSAALLNGDSLPSWIHFDGESKALSVDKIPTSALPLKIKVKTSVGGKVSKETVLTLMAM